MLSTVLNLDYPHCVQDGKDRHNHTSIINQHYTYWNFKLLIKRLAGSSVGKEVEHLAPSQKPPKGVEKVGGFAELFGSLQKS